MTTPACKLRYERSEKGRARKNRYQTSEKGREVQRRYRLTLRGAIANTMGNHRRAAEKREEAARAIA